MARALKLATVWRVVRDVDLEAIRTAVGAPFEIHLVGDDETDAERMKELLNGTGEAVPWLVTEGQAERATSEAPPPLALVLLSRTHILSGALAAARDAARRRRVPVLAVVVDASVPAASTAPRDEASRIVTPSLDSAAAAELATALVSVAPGDYRLAVARRVPLARPAVFTALIEETARANAAFALTTGLAETIPVLTAPLNVGDIVVLTKNQLVMSYKMALVAGREGNPRKLLAEILGVLGGGMLLRQMARQLVGLLPVVGLLPKVAVAYGGTWAIGRAMVAWLTEGRQLTTETLRGLSDEGLERGRTVARRMIEQARASRDEAARQWERLRARRPNVSRRT